MRVVRPESVGVKDGPNNVIGGLKRRTKKGTGEHQITLVLSVSLIKFRFRIDQGGDEF